MNICLMGDSLIPIGNYKTGYGVAVDSLASNIIKLSEYDNIYCLCEKGTYHYDKITEYKNELTAYKKKRIHIVDEYDVFLQGSKILGNIDVIHSLQGDALKALHLRNLLNKNIPIVLTMHGISEQRLYMYLYIPLLIFPFKPYDAIICTSEAVRITISRIFERLMKQFPKQIKNTPQIVLKRIPLGVDTDYFKPLEKNALRKKWNIKVDAFVILWFGRLSKYHKADLTPTLKVFSNLVQINKHKELILIIAGSSKDRYYEKEILNDAKLLGISEYVRMIESCEISDRNELYNISDIFTSPVDNIQETFGITPIEAMAAGVAQIVSDWDGYRDTVEEGVTGFLIPTYWMNNCLDDITERGFLPFNDNRRSEFYACLETESIAVDIEYYQKRIQQIIDSPNLLDYMKVMSRKRAINKFEISNIVRQIDLLWTELNSLANNANTYNSTKLNIVDYCHDFQAYPTQMLDDETIFHKSKNMDSWKTIIKPTKDISMQQIFDMIELISKEDVVSVNSITSLYVKSEKSLIRRVLMYFFKNGLIKI